MFFFVISVNESMKFKLWMWVEVPTAFKCQMVASCDISNWME